MSRLAAMRIITWLLAASGVAFGLFTIVFGIIGPDQDIHAVHNAVVASLLLIVTAPAGRGTEVRAVAAANEERAAMLATMRPARASGWTIRTLGSGDARPHSRTCASRV